MQKLPQRKPFNLIVVMLPASRLVLQDRYVIQQDLQSGLLGPTMLVTSRETDALLVCKVCHKSFIASPDSFRKRLDLLAQVKLPFVVPYIDIIETDTDFFLIRECVQTGSLADFVNETERIHDKTILSIWQMLVDIFQILHENGIFPSSVRPNNIFIASETSLLITDLYELRSDISWAIQTPDTSHLAFLAPEFLDGSAPPSSYSDVWSLGVILLYLKRRALPWSTKNIFMMVKTMNEGCTSGATNDDIEMMARAILVCDAARRPPIGMCCDISRLRTLAQDAKPSILRTSAQKLINSTGTTPHIPKLTSARERTFTVRHRIVSGACSARACPFAPPLLA